MSVKKVIATNKQARLNFNILETWDAGLKLAGAEVKSVKNGNINLKGSYISLETNTNGQAEAWLNGAHIARYAKAGYSQKDYKPDRSRKLLLTKKELGNLTGKIKQKGLTIIPLSVYTTRGFVKVNLALVKGKKKYDKREALKKREFARRQKRLLNK